MDSGSDHVPSTDPSEQSIRPDRVIAEAPIVAVAVYPSSARITRRGTARVVTTAGPSVELVVDDLPRRLDPDSVRVTGRGPVRILGVDVRDHRRATASDQAVLALETERDALRQRLAELADDDDAQQARRGFLDVALRTGAAALARSLARPPTADGPTGDGSTGGGSTGGGSTGGGSTADDQARATAAAVTRLTVAADLLVEQVGDVYARRRGIATEREQADRRLAAVERAIAPPTTAKNPDSRQVVVTVEPLDTAAGPDGVHVELDVSYVVLDASWTSVYDARLDGERLTLSWFGMVTQRTGEDWPACELTLSTARPTAGARLPELPPWFVGGSPTPPGRNRGGPVPTMAGGAEASVPLPAAMTLMAAAPAPAGPPPRPVETVTAALDSSGAAASYRLARPVPVPADGTPHRATVATLELDVALDYLTVPKLVAEAHLRATVTNTTDHTFRPGKVSIFHGAEFVGSSQLDAVPPGAEFELHLGIDDRLAVERKLVRRNTGKRMVGNTRRTEVGYRITLSNHTGRGAKVTVNDQVPVSTNAEVEIRDEQTAPAPDDRSELGILTWTLTLDPDQERRIEFGFRVEHQKGTTVAGI